MIDHVLINTRFNGDTQLSFLFVMSLFAPPKTPNRQRVRSETKTPLTPSILAGLNNISLASTPSHRPRGTRSKSSAPAPFDVSNPFLAPPRSRPASPIKRTTAPGNLAVSDDLHRQASGGVIRKGGIESRLDVVTLDYIPPQKSEIKRSKSTPAIVCLL